MKLDPIPSIFVFGALTIVVGGLALTLAQAVASFHSTWRRRRFFRHLVALTPGEPDTPSRYQENAAPFAMAAGFEFIGAYRASGRTRRRMRAELWRATNHQTLALISSERLRWARRHRTELISVLDNGQLITTTDEGGDGDPLFLRGETVSPAAGFRDLAAQHEVRLRNAGWHLESFGSIDPAGVLEDLERARVDTLVARGLAFHRDPAQTAWSYTFRGACAVYYPPRTASVPAPLPGQPAPTTTAE